MNTLFDSVEVLDTKKEIQKENVSYEHAGYQIRVHFNGEKTLIQCIQNLTERKIARQGVSPAPVGTPPSSSA